MKTNKGFTLVELLVVIAIIVTLASIVLVGIQSATKRAKDARVIADMSQLRSQIEIEKDASGRNGLYDFVDGICTAASSTEVLCEDIRKQVTSTAGYSFVVDEGDATNWCIRVPLISGAESYCIDAVGKAGKTTSTPCTEADKTCGTVY